MRWKEDETRPELDGYNMWELDTAAALWSGDLLVPAFIELSPGDPAGNGDAIDGVLALNAADTGACLLPDHEVDHLVQIRASGGGMDQSVCTVVFCRPDRLSNPSLWRVLSVGSPVAGPQVGQVAAPAITRPLPASAGVEPIIAIIDDGIGFLNARFRKDAVHTRIEAIWIMGPDRAPARAATAPGGGTGSGRVLTAGDIDDLLASGRDEADIYRDLNDSLFPPGTHRSTDRSFGHGTHVLDLAAGQDIAGDRAEGPILAVQLPPEAIAATSGRRLEHYILQGLRWVLRQAVLLNQGRDKPAPVIVNLSLGALAGPKDGTGFFETWLKQEIAAFQANPGSANIPLRIVAAYGNARRSRLVADRTLEPGRGATVNWNILPDDRTASYLELRVTKGSGASVGVDFVPPGALPALHLPSLLTGRQMRTLSPDRTFAAGAFAMAEDGQDTMLLALAPTQAEPGQSVSEPGPWKLILTNRGDQPCQVSLRIRRDDTPAGFRMAGRQSWLDDADGWSWDKETMDWSSPNLASAVTRQGTEVNFSSVASASVYFVAAGEPDPATEQALRPSPYSAEGKSGKSTAPTLLARGDDGRMLAGRRATGVLSGSSRRMSGTSAAAPVAVARLAAAIREGLVLDPAPAGSQPGDDEIGRLLVSQAAAVRDPRRGAGQVR